ncbi:SIMPL domain-containing protein [Defluviimonas sp. WL0002]|uniref:SIMPL domain-containing protein n=1 Tax=Albidovulum marisflavi TaxID=2984159 RepID=A0ABT2ZB79_9RHOB|nr:SIMPL domain-containing protein [Defluviimonas sp. WL0002]MCV2868395.1 SIMPL domain-containing protein [Defluviimonas sp. WL0002]
MRILPLVFSALLIASPAFAQDAPSVISVTGQGTIAAMPDMATISLGVATNGSTAREALDANSEAIAAVLSRLTASGIAEKDIQTSGLSLGPVYDYSSANEGRGPKLTGFQASNMVTVKVRALNELGALLDTTVGEGANTINGVFFGLEESDAKADEARLAAMADARRKAELLAEAADVRLGRIVSISEGGVAMPMGGMGAVAFERAAAPVPIAEGEVTVSASVSISWEIDQ